MTLAQAIAKMEGFDRPGTVPARLHNPGDLLYAGQRGAKPYPIIGEDGATRRYARFGSDAAGWNALKRQLALDASRGHTIATLIHKWAPASDGNDPEGYLQTVCKWLEIEPDTRVSKQLLLEAGRALLSSPPWVE